MAEAPAVSFAVLLRRLRMDAGLTQEELASAARLSYRSISDLERGVNLTARRETARLLADALHLSGADRAAFEAAARGRALAATPAVQESRAGTVAVATRTLPRDVASFTGRERELAYLVGVVADRADSGGMLGICAIGGMAASARPPLRFMPLTGLRRSSRTGRSSCHCTAIPQGSGRPIRQTRWRAFCRHPASPSADPSRAGAAGMAMARSPGRQADAAGAGRCVRA